MAFWTGSIQDINEGLAANDGTGDTIRAAFFKVDTNFQQINNFLGNTTIDFLTANVVTKLNAGNANIVNLTTNSLTITNAVATGNITAGNIIANTGLYSSGDSHFNSNVYVAGSIVPVGGGLYDLGSAANPFRKIYYNEASAGGTVTTSDAGMLIVHANASVGDVKDVGIQGNISHSYNSNTYAYFGFQKDTQSFIYKIGPTNWALGNSVAYDGIYGAAHFGSGNFSNTTISTSTSTGTLVVGGGAGVGGNINVGGNARIAGDVYITGNAYANGNYAVITSSIIGNYGAPYTGGIINGNAVFVSGAATTNAYTGAVTVPYGGVGVFGNVNAGGLVGPYYGQVQTAAQPNITSLGTLPTLTAATINFTNINGTNITAGGLLNFAGATMTGLATLTLSGNLTASNLVTAGAVFAPTIYSNGYRYANGSAFISTSVANTADITANLSSGYNIGVSLTTTGVTAGNYGSATSIPTIVVDSKGRITSLTANAVSTTVNLSGNTGSGSVAGGGTLTVVGGSNGGITTSVSGAGITITNNGVLSATGSFGLTLSGSTGNVTFTNSGVTSLIAGTDISVSGSTGNITVNDTSTLNTVLGRGATTTRTMTVGHIVPSANLTYDVGSSSAWFNTFYGVSSQAKYADLAERYTSDAEYEPGTVVVFGGSAEITTTTQFGDVSVAGVISTDPAYLMNAMAEGLPVALRGRVPVKVLGPVTKGDLLVTAGQNPGYATSVGKSKEFPLAVFAKALETNTAEGTKIIEAVII